jgi:hypothetical protein
VGTPWNALVSAHAHNSRNNLVQLKRRGGGARKWGLLKNTQGHAALGPPYFVNTRLEPPPPSPPPPRPEREWARGNHVACP